MLLVMGGKVRGVATVKQQEATPAPENMGFFSRRFTAELINAVGRSSSP